MFDPVPIRRVFEEHGFEFGPVSGAHLPQRSFANKAERQNVLKLLLARNIDTRGLEDRGKHIANLFIAARRERYPDLRERMEATLRRQLAIHGPTSHDD